MSRYLENRLARRAVLARLTAGAALGVGGLGTARDAARDQSSPSPTGANATVPGVTHRQIEANGISVHVAEAGSGPLVVLVHGWPEIWYSWRHQLPALAAAGYHAVALDMRGYGATDVPEPVESYSMRNQLADLIGLLDALEAERAVLVGHDLGAGITWACAELHPERVAAHVAVGIPYGPRPSEPVVERTRAFAGDSFSFLDFFQRVGAAEAELEADPRRSLLLISYALSGDAPPDLVPYLFTGKPADAGILDGIPEPEMPLPWLTDEDLDIYAEAFQQSGFRGSLGIYRNMDQDWADLTEIGTIGVTQPALFIGGRRDATLRFGGASIEVFDAMVAGVPNLRKIVLLPGIGHWTQQEAPDVVNTELIDFLQREIGE